MEKIDFFAIFEVRSKYMILKFSFSNIFSFKDTQEISFIPEPLKELDEHLFEPKNYGADIKLLKSLCVYGHNSHGKSNILKTFDFFISFIKHSFTQPKSIIPVEQFAFNIEMLNKASSFELTFLIDDTKYRYGFEITTERIISEWLYYAPFSKKENYLFHRIEQEFRISKLWSKELDNKIENQLIPFAKQNVLLLSILSAQDAFRINEISKLINSIIIIRDLNNNNLLPLATTIFSNPDYYQNIQNFIEGADLGFSTILDKIERRLSDKKQYDQEFLKNMFYSDQIKRFELYTKHDVYDKSYKKLDVIEFEMIKRESDGSIKFFIVVSLLVYAMKNNCLILIDELDSRFHSDLLELLILKYHNPNQNNLGSQLFFTSHNTVLLDKKLRRDQILLIEKNEYGESFISKMHTKERPIRIDASIEKDYRKGKLGGISKKIKKDPNQGLLF